MALRKILTEEDPILKKKCHLVTHFDRRLHNLLDDLRETLADANGAGLAAPQIGILRRVTIIMDENDEILELVNPTILTEEGEQEGIEGCLSLPGLWGTVKRPMKVRVRAQNRKGEAFELEGEEMVARCLCHEIEHLDGHLYSEHTDKLFTTDELNEILEKEENERT